VSKRITVVTSEPLGRAGTGGAGTADSLLAVALGRHGHEVELLVASGRVIGALSPEWTQRYAEANVSVRVLARLSGVRPDALAPTLEVFHALRDRPPDVAVVNDWRGLGYASMRARQLGRTLTETAFVVHCHGPGRVLAEFAQKVPDTLARFAEEITERASVELADALVSPSAWLVGWMREHNWPVPDSAAVIQYVRQSAALDETPERAPAGDPVRRLAFFGKLREGKGIRIFLAALETLDPDLLDGVEIVFLGGESARWTREQVLSSQAAARLETNLTREEALNELRRPGTLAVMPSLLDNSPNTVSECIEHGIPFVATAVGGIPELVAEEDRARVLCAPTTADLAAALTRALEDPGGFGPARPAREAGDAVEAWLELVGTIERSSRREARPPTHVAVVAAGEESARRAQRLAQHTQSVEVEIVRSQSRRPGFERTSAAWVLFLDEEDLPDDDLLDTLVAAQIASNADLVTAAVRPTDGPEGVQLFLGDPGALGLVENQYGVLGLLRSELAAAQPLADGGSDPDWPLFARVALGGARVVSLPEPLSTHDGKPGQVGDVPGQGLAVLEAFERMHPDQLQELPQLAATLAAAHARGEAQSAPATSNGHLGPLVRKIGGRVSRLLKLRRVRP
jgi:glycosyltransferase involved in cell wall biosynthesis